MRRLGTAGLLAALALAFALAGCGGGGEDPTAADTAGRGQAEPRPVGSYAGEANAICASIVAAGQRVGSGLDSSRLPSGPLALTTSLIAPAIPILEAGSRRLRALTRRPTSGEFEGYVGVFDPILALLRSRVAAGRDGNSGLAKELDMQLIELAALQRDLARESGLEGCDVDFVQAFAGAARARP